mmetsp:Transcript_38151/g.53743  ORF Transcript_38151/g.53743 Transcript_38151/m.53743 type:complete len:85 (+) Transcript_38151:1302-1556(+)
MRHFRMRMILSARRSQSLNRIPTGKARKPLSSGSSAQRHFGLCEGSPVHFQTNIFRKKEEEKMSIRESENNNFTRVKINEIFNV